MAVFPKRKHFCEKIYTSSGFKKFKFKNFIYWRQNYTDKIVITFRATTHLHHLVDYIYLPSQSNKKNLACDNSSGFANAKHRLYENA